MAIAVLATVGGALAFKVKKFGESKYCYIISANTPPSGECTFTTINSKMVEDQGSSSVWYTTTSNASQQACAQLTQCPNFAKTFID